MKKYIVGKKVQRDRIAIDIRDGAINRDTLKMIVEDPDIQKAFIGREYTNKISKENWDYDYLNRLVKAVVAEAFNEDYLFYLLEVSEYVNSRLRKQKRVKNTIFIVSGVLVIVVITAIWINMNK